MPILHWLDDEEARKTSTHIPYRLLEADSTLSHGEPTSENMLIHGDNLEALKALLPYYAGQVKCIFIDPPYNTRSAFEHYDDNLEHSIWLSTMYPRLEMLRDLLADDGSIWVTIDENEGHYLKVLMDEVFGRNSFISTIVWENFYGRSNAAAISPAHNYILCYSLIGDGWKHVRRLLPRTEKSTGKYSNPDNDPRGSWRLGPIFAAEERHEGLMYTISTPSGRKVSPPKGSHWRMTEDEFWRLVKDNRISFGTDGNNIPALKLYLSEVQDGLVPRSWWPHTEAGHTQDGKREVMALFPGETPFGTPKPEKLLRNIIEIASSPADIVLDSFLGSGTTAAVAHKMGRRYIGIEMGDHAVTHCAPRLKMVIEGEQGGISKEVNWQGGGGFHFYRLGETVFDEEGKINPKVKFPALAAHVWFTETHTPWHRDKKDLRGFKNLGGLTSLLGVHNGIGYYLLYNGILGDTTKDGGNVLTMKILRDLPAHEGARIIYGEQCTLSPDTLKRKRITFKHIPYDIKAR